MNLRGLSRVFLLASFVLLVGFVSGCGGGESQQDGGGGSQPQESGSDEGTSGAQGDGGGEGSREIKTALGNIASAKVDKKRFVLRPTGEGERMVFRLREKTRIRLDGREANAEDIKKGQQAQIKYIVKNERNVARIVTLFGGGGGEGGGTGG